MNDFNGDARRMRIKKVEPVQIFIPSNIIPTNISNDTDHLPTLNSCFHKCPKKCPPTYAPICGRAGRMVREPALMFLNHCYMDIAQCKIFRENKSPSSSMAAYQEASFVFCLGETLNNMFMFLPLLKTLQHMGRLPKKGRFRYRLSNLKIFNNMLNFKDPNIRGLGVRKHD